MGLQDRDYMNEKTKLREKGKDWKQSYNDNFKDKKFKNAIENITVGNAITIISIIIFLLIVWKNTNAKLEEIQLKNIANEASKRMNQEREKEEKMMRHFINQSNENIKQIQDAYKKGLNQMQNPYEQYTNQFQENTIEPNKKIKGTACITSSTTKEKTCKHYN